MNSRAGFDMQRITATELQKNLSHYRTEARTAPVIITDRGRDDVALIPVSMLQKMLSSAQEKFPAEARKISDYDRFFRIVKEYVAGTEFAKYTHRIENAFCFTERLMTFTMIDAAHFELAGYIFRVEGSFGFVEKTCDWIERPEPGIDDCVRAWEARLSMAQIFTKNGGKAWRSHPAAADVAGMGFVTALVGLQAEEANMSQWMADQALNSITWESDTTALLKRFEAEALSVLRDNISNFRNSFPDLDVTAFQASFGQPVL